MAKKNDRPRVLVTGGAGFIGSHVAERLLERYSVVALDDLSGGFKENVPRGAELIKGTILDRALLRRLFKARRFTYVFHLAAYAAEGLSHFIRHYNYENNLIGSINLINLSVEFEVKRFVFASSIAVYGKNQLPMREDMTPRPEDPYGVAKLAVEQDLRAAREMFGLDYTIFRPHNVYGERQNVGDRYRNVIGIFMNQIMRGEPLTIFGDGSQTRAFSYIDGVAIPIAGCVDLPETAGEVFNVGADTPYAVNDLAKAVMRAMGKELPVNHLPARNEVAHAYSDHSKARKFFPDAPAVPLEEGLKRMARWALEHGPRKTKPFARVELTRNLPPSWRAFK